MLIEKIFCFIVADNFVSNKNSNTFVLSKHIKGFKNMKKLVLGLLFVAAVSVTSCKKESEVAPKKVDKVVKMNNEDIETVSGDKGTVSQWD